MCLLLGTLNDQVNIFICLYRIKSTSNYLDKKIKSSLVELFQSLIGHILYISENEILISTHLFVTYFFLITWSRKWQPTPVFLPGKFLGQRCLVGYSPPGPKESDK